MILENFSMIPGYQQSESLNAISMETSNDSYLNLYAYGKVSIKGGPGLISTTGRGGNGGWAIYCSTLYIRHAEKLNIYGGDGGKGMENGMGGTGAHAVVVEQNLIKPRGYTAQIWGGSFADIQASNTSYEIRSGNSIIYY